MLSFKHKDIGIDCPLVSQRISDYDFTKYLLLIPQKLPKKLKNYESKSNLWTKKNIKIYIPLQTMVSSRGCL
jgi:hypothetical protein